MEASTTGGELDHGYQPPRIERLGTIAELTAGPTSGAPDSVSAGSAAVSDRRLKHHLAPIDAQLVLRALVRLV